MGAVARFIRQATPIFLPSVFCKCTFIYYLRALKEDT